MNRVRLAIDARPLAYAHNGIGRYLRSILEHLDTARFDVRLYSDVRLPTEWTCRFAHRCYPLPVGKLSSLLSQFLFSVWCRLDSIDVFWGTRHQLPLLSGCKNLLTVHDLVWRKAPETMVGFGRILEAGLMPLALRRAHHVVVPSRSTKQDVIEYHPRLHNSISVTHLGNALGVIDGADVGEPEDDKLRLLCVATLEPRKNHLELLQAYERAWEQTNGGVELVLVGAVGWKAETIQEQIAKMQPKGVRYLGVCSDDHLQSAYRNCDVVVLPSLYEGFGLSLLEGLAAGKPVITSDVSSMPEIAGSAGILIQPGDLSGLAAAIVCLARDKPLYAHFRSKTKIQASKFSWENCAELTARAIEDLVAS